MNPDQFIDELLKKKYQQESLIEALKMQTTNNDFLDIDQSNIPKEKTLTERMYKFSPGIFQEIMQYRKTYQERIIV